jgi:hypothetical protein
MAISIKSVPPEPSKPSLSITGLDLDTVVALRDIVYFLNDQTRRRDFPKLDEFLNVVNTLVTDSDFDGDEFVLVPDLGDITFKRERRVE